MGTNPAGTAVSPADMGISLADRAASLDAAASRADIDKTATSHSQQALWDVVVVGGEGRGRQFDGDSLSNSQVKPRAVRRSGSRKWLPGFHSRTASHFVSR